MDYTRYYRAAMEYLQDLQWRGADRLGHRGSGCQYARKAFPSALPAFTCIGANVFPSSAEAFGYFYRCIEEDLSRRVGPTRVLTFLQHLNAIALLHNHATGQPDMTALWNRRRNTELRSLTFSPQQQDILDFLAASLHTDGRDVLAEEHAQKQVYVSGDPGTGKTEVMIHGCYRAALAGCHVLIMCPTGTLVHSYRDRVPDHPNIVIETLHSALVIKRRYDEVVQYCPPSRLRRYDLIMIDEVSQIDDELLEKLRIAIGELPQRPVLLLSGDFYQLGPMQSQRATVKWLIQHFKHK